MEKIFKNNHPILIRSSSARSEIFSDRTVQSICKKAVVKFDTTKVKFEANVWVTWVVRNLGEDVLGHATLGKGVVEVAIGSYGCDGSFQLFGVDTVEYIMTHELGHSISLGHSTNPESMMYPSISNTDYAYCLLN